MTVYKKTPTIKNVQTEKTDTAESKLAVVQRIIKRWRIKEEEAKLFQFYATKPTGFKACQDQIAKETGILRNHINRARDKLVARKLIDFSPNISTVTLDWQVLKGLACIPDDIDVRKGEILPLKNSEDEEQKLRALYGLDLPDVNPEHLTFGCKLNPETFFEEGTSVPNAGWIKDRQGDSPVLFESGALKTYDLPF